jgi:hypothetical protein
MIILSYDDYSLSYIYISPSAIAYIAENSDADRQEP